MGGRTTLGVVRVGHTVRRPPSLNSDFVHRLLTHLEQAGFGGAPRTRGRDDQGRDVLSFIMGEVPSELDWHADAVLTEAARLIRRYHDATADLLSQASRMVGLEVICHNDLSPCNFVFQAGRPVAIIDFDAAAPGTRVLDLGYAAWLWLDLGNSEASGTEQRRRLDLFLEAYGVGGPAPPELVAAIVRRQVVLLTEGARTGQQRTADWAQNCLSWTRKHLDTL